MSDEMIPAMYVIQASAPKYGGQSMIRERWYIQQVISERAFSLMYDQPFAIAQTLRFMQHELVLNGAIPREIEWRIDYAPAMPYPNEILRGGDLHGD